MSSHDVTALIFFYLAAGNGAPDTAMKLNQCFYKADPEVSQQQMI
jgi:hypothetical protein